MKFSNWPSKAIAKSTWAQRLTLDCMAYRTDPIKAWKAMRTLEKGLTHNHTTCRTVRMQKPDGNKAVTDKENAEVFCEHFSRIFNNKNPLPCKFTA
eukprot:8567061-Ditylum_brightwellii.AAC.1